MPEFLSSGVEIPLEDDQPRRQAVEALAKSVDKPRGVTYDGKIRLLELTSDVTVSTTQDISGWEPRDINGDQGDRCGILLDSTGETLTLTEDGFYVIICRLFWQNNGGAGARRTTVQNSAGTLVYAEQTNTLSSLSYSVQANNALWITSGTVLKVTAFEGGGSGDGVVDGNSSFGSDWTVGKTRLM